MELLAIAHLLWERRLLVVLGAVVAVAAALLVGRAMPGPSAGYGAGMVRMVLDTTDSQLVKAAPVGAATLPMRARLLATKLAADTSRTTIAAAAGVPRDELTVLSPADKALPVIETPLVKQVGAAASDANAPYVVEVFTPEETPLITIKTSAVDPAHAARLAGVAAAGLQDLLIEADKSQSRGFVLRTVAPVRAIRVVSPSRRPFIMLAAALMVFCLWCGSVVLASGLAARARRPTPRRPAPVS
jgi:hypothetical protein